MFLWFPSVALEPCVRHLVDPGWGGDPQQLVVSLQGLHPPPSPPAGHNLLRAGRHPPACTRQGWTISKFTEFSNLEIIGHFGKYYVFVLIYFLFSKLVPIIPFELNFGKFFSLAQRFLVNPKWCTTFPCHIWWCFLGDSHRCLSAQMGSHSKEQALKNITK